MKPINLYIHTPFCASRCLYCGFFTLASQDELIIKKYFKQLQKEIGSYKERLKGYEVKTIYFGGGTPSFVDKSHIGSVLDAIKSNFRIGKNCEITLESNPESFSVEKARYYKKIGINRLSFGLQACQEAHLKFLRRGHTFAKFLEAFHAAREVKFKNINIDLIYGFPQLTLKDWGNSLKAVAKLSPEHISCYSLELKSKSALGNLVKTRKINLPDEKFDRLMLKLTRSYLEKSGYKQYELANFSKEGFECVHNMDFWSYRDYIGFGAGAHSYFNSYRWRNKSNLDDYLNKKIFKYVNMQIPKKDQIFEYLMLGLRKTEGINSSEFKKRFRLDFTRLFREKVIKLCEIRLVKLRNNNLILTKKGQNYLNDVLSEFLPD